MSARDFNELNEHHLGHFIPLKTPWRRFLANYMRDPGGDIPGPGGLAAPPEPEDPVTPRLLD